jgi:hypothetical protein
MGKVGRQMLMEVIYYIIQNICTSFGGLEPAKVNRDELKSCYHCMHKNNVFHRNWRLHSISYNLQIYIGI